MKKCRVYTLIQNSLFFQKYDDLAMATKNLKQGLKKTSPVGILLFSMLDLFIAV